MELHRRWFNLVTQTIYIKKKNKSLNEVIDDLKNKESAIYKSIKKIILEFDENGKHVINKAVEALILDYENEITEILED